MELKKFTHIYFIGIGGIGMSAIARWFLKNGFAVSGYDKTETPLTKQLVEEGASVHYVDDVALISDNYKNKETALVVYTPAIPKDHTEFNFYRNQNSFTILKRSAVLGLITKDYFTIAVAGTHGKTTTSTMVAHLLKHAGKNVTAFLGGIASNYNSNLILAEDQENQVVVVEADEYDRSFLQLSPNVVVLTSTEPDHLDIYGSKEEVTNSFKAFIEKLPKDGKLIAHEAIDESVKDLQETLTVYGFENAEFKPENLTHHSGEIRFSLEGEGYTLPMSGYHNVLNATGALLACKQIGVSYSELKAALADFKGIKRRFEYQIRDERHVYIDDYAHHPSELKAAISGTRGAFPNKKLTVVFQPHLFSRTQDFMAEFAEELSKADEVLLLDIYPARELPIPGVTSEVLFEKITAKTKFKTTLEEVVELVKNIDPELLLTLGAGNIDTKVEEIKNELSNQHYVA